MKRNIQRVGDRNRKVRGFDSIITVFTARCFDEQSENKGAFQSPKYEAFFLLFICACFQKLYDGKWHQLKLLVRPKQITGFLDDRLIQERKLEPMEPIYINGETQVAKRREHDITVPVSTC